MRKQLSLHSLLSILAMLVIPLLCACGGSSDDDGTDSDNGNKGGDKPSASTEYVDLGLSVKWAACNLGASKPWEYGNYYSWGETTPKETYSDINYKYVTYASQADYLNGKGFMTKYCFSHALNGTPDNKKTLESQDDAATAMLGGKWRMPTPEEYKELIEKCRWSWRKINGIGGYNIIGKNGNSIFLPAAGYYNENENNSIDDYGRYWANSIESEEDDENGVTLRFYSPSPEKEEDSDTNPSYYMSSRSRFYGQSIRPVHP